ncbi:MAG: ATP-dependent zinc protease [Flavobacteriaceae bacterium]|nr:ATP-dependent zinc protease [Flavobacteriaceae bacterium]
METKNIIGRIDKADFPEFSLENIPIKIDSGAYTSSIHCSSIKEVIINKKRTLKFHLLDESYRNFNVKEHLTDTFSSKIVKSSNGISEKRYMILTNITLFNKTYPIYLTLSERTEMKFPILLGRKFLNKKFVIDTTKSNLSYKLKTQ